MARRFVVRLLPLVVLLSPVAARAGGWSSVAPAGVAGSAPPPNSFAEQRAAEIRADWQRRGLADAAPEMIAVLCNYNYEWLHKTAGDELARHGGAAMPYLLKAAANDRCRVVPAMAAIACAGPIVEDGAAGQRVWDDAVAPLLKGPWFLGTSVLWSMAFQHSQRNCAASEVVFPRAMPALAAALRADSYYGGRVPGIARQLGPLAAPLVPDLILLLEKGDASSAAQALGAIGPQAAPAVPALRDALRAAMRRGPDVRLLVIRALGGIGEAAGPAIADFAPLLKRAMPDLCHLQPRESEDDTITWEIADAAGRIGGPALAPLFPDLVAAYRLLRSCRLLGTGDWNRLFAAAGRSGRDVTGALLAVALDPDEALAIRRTALASLDQVGTSPEAQARLATVRAGLARKAVLFSPRDGAPEPQRRPPPGPPVAPDPRQTPRAFELCRQEAGLPARAAPASVAPVSADFSHAAFVACVEDRLCGPDQATYGATMSVCCRPYGAERPWFCEPRAPPR